MEKFGYNEVRDYQMSEKFGLDWKEYDSERMYYFMEIMSAKNKREQKEASKNNKKQKYGRH